MARFEELKRMAQNAAYTAVEKAQSVAAAVGEKAGAAKEVAKTNISLVTEKRNLEKSYQALGEWFAAQCGDDAPEGAGDLLAAIRLTQEKLEALKTLKMEQDASARELLNRGKEFLAEKAETLAALAKKPREGAAQKPVGDEAETPAEAVEEPVGDDEASQNVDDDKTEES